jgi:D-glycero-beta-D-manno-heptose 1-phosphate adenylyltransferase
MMRLTAIEAKINDKEKTAQLIRVWRLRGDKIVFTNGCFDILHRGHITYLAQAAAQGNRLVVAINSDASVKSLGKGDNRPVNNENDRAFVLSALGFVDAVVIFDESTPADLIAYFKPDVLVKGGDYDAEEKDPASKKYIVGRDSVIADGGKVITIPLVEGYSTTGILGRV